MKVGDKIKSFADAVSLTARIGKKESILTQKAKEQEEEELGDGPHIYIGPKVELREAHTDQQMTMPEHFVTTNDPRGYEALLIRNDAQEGYVAIGHDPSETATPREKLKGAEARVGVIDIPGRGRFVFVERPAAAKKHPPQDAFGISFGEDENGFTFATHIADGTTRIEVPRNWVEDKDEDDWIVSGRGQDDYVRVINQSGEFAAIGARNTGRTMFRGCVPSIDVLLNYFQRNAPKFGEIPDKVGSSTLQAARGFLPDENPRTMHLEITCLAPTKDLGEAILQYTSGKHQEVELQGNPYYLDYTGPEPLYTPNTLKRTGNSWTDTAVFVHTSDGFILRENTEEILGTLTQTPEEIVDTLGNPKFISQKLEDPAGAGDDGTFVAFVPASLIPSENVQTQARATRMLKERQAPEEAKQSTSFEETVERLQGILQTLDEKVDDLEGTREEREQIQDTLQEQIEATTIKLTQMQQRFPEELETSQEALLKNGEQVVSETEDESIQAIINLNQVLQQTVLTHQEIQRAVARKETLQEVTNDLETYSQRIDQHIEALNAIRETIAGLVNEEVVQSQRSILQGHQKALELSPKIVQYENWQEAINLFIYLQEFSDPDKEPTPPPQITEDILAQITTLIPILLDHEIIQLGQEGIENAIQLFRDLLDQDEGNVDEIQPVLLRYLTNHFTNIDIQALRSLLEVANSDTHSEYPKSIVEFTKLARTKLQSASELLKEVPNNGTRKRQSQQLRERIPQDNA
jgi:hypothetical protein